MVPALRDLQPYVFTREGGGGQVFWNWQTFVLNGAGDSSQLHSIVNRHGIDEYSR